MAKNDSLQHGTGESGGTNRETLRIFWQASLQDKPHLALAFLHTIGGILMTVGVPFIIGRIIAAIATGEDAMDYIPYLVGIGVVGVIANRIGAQALFALQARTMGYLQAKSFDALMRRSVGFHNNNVGGKLVSDAIDFPSAYSSLNDALFTNLLQLVLILICGAIVVTIDSWQLGLVVAVMVTYAFGSGVYDTWKRRNVRMLRLKSAKAVTSHLADSITNVHTVKTFAHEPSELSKHRKLNATLTRVRVNDWSSGARAGNTRIAVLFIMQVIFILFLIHLVRKDPSVLDAGIFAFSFITMMSTRLFIVNVMLRQIEDGFLNASPMTEILLQQPEILDAPDATELKADTGAVDLNKVQFRYVDSGKEDKVFEKLDLHIKPGEKVGLVGPSGGGKSTLTRLILRFEDIEAGTISIDGQDIAGVTQESLRRSISYVPQEPLLFHRTIAENIAYGRTDATLADIEQAAKQAYAHDFICELNDGYDTIVGERGVKLSGGQRQRIAIARAILKDAPVLILDEATSALDSESEVYIQQALWKLMQKRTALVIAHRLSTVQKLDRIIVLENGRITEQGSHAALLKQHGTYAKLWNHQSGGFIED